MSWGEWLGTHWLFSVFRSTSQSCSQSSLCAGAADCNHSVSDTIGLVASRLAELHTEGYSLVGMKRDQDHLSMVDPARLHGFVILKMTSSDSSIRYMRLDWGENGLGFQEQDTEEALMTYMENKESEERESSVGVRTGAGAVAGTTALGALAWWATALTPSGAVGAAVIGVSVVVVWASGLVWLDAEDDHIHADFQGVDDQDEALRRLYKELRTLQREGHAYSLTSWNCNHFANHLVHEMINRPIFGTACLPLQPAPTATARYLNESPTSPVPVSMPPPDPVRSVASAPRMADGRHRTSALLVRLQASTCFCFTVGDSSQRIHGMWSSIVRRCVGAE